MAQKVVKHDTNITNPADKFCPPIESTRQIMSPQRPARANNVGVVDSTALP